jgi:hypothetical protein
VGWAAITENGDNKTRKKIPVELAIPPKAKVVRKVANKLTPM